MKQIKDMTTAEWRKAWTGVLRQLGDIDEFGSPEDQDGLCCMFARFCSISIESEMALFRDSLGVYGYWFFWDQESLDYRATFAAMFAAMTPKEFLEICEAPRG